MRLVALTLCTVVAAGLAAPAALGNGDPPSDVLLTADIYAPAEPASPALISELRSAARRANDAGYPAKVAVVQSAIDLGNVAQAFNRPQQYADYLAADLGKHPESVGSGFALLVVMPAGAGLAGKTFDADERKAARTIDVRTGASSNELVQAATSTLEKLSAAGGHPIGGAGGSGGGGSSAGVIIGVLGGLLVLTTVAILASRARSRASDGPGETPPQ